MPNNNSQLEKRLWDAADQLRANSKLRPAEYSMPVLGLIFLRYADKVFTATEKVVHAEQPKSTRRQISKIDFHEKGALYLPQNARWAHIMRLPEGANIGSALNDAMRLIEKHNDDLKGALPKTYNRMDNALLLELLRNFNTIPMDIEGDAFGRIYEYFLGNFARAEGQRGGEFFTPTSIVKLMVEILEPYHGRVYDPACGSGGMFVQSAGFRQRHRANGRGLKAISVFGQERVAETVRLCRMNLAVHGLAGDIRQANSYYEDLHRAPGRFDFVLANPPFNVNGVDKERLKDDTVRFPFGMPHPDNANYLWIQLFYSSLNETGRAGFVMANSAADAGASELEIRKRLIQDRAVDVMVAVGPNFFYTVTLPCTLWFLDKGKKGTPRQDCVLFLDARAIYNQIDRAHRDWTPAQIDLLAAIVRLYRGEGLNSFTFDSSCCSLPQPALDALEAMFVAGRYADIPGLCKAADLAEIEVQGWSLIPGRYVGLGDNHEEDFDFYQRMKELHEELEYLNREARKLETQISENIGALLRGRYDVGKN